MGCTRLDGVSAGDNVDRLKSKVRVGPGFSGCVERGANGAKGSDGQAATKNIAARQARESPVSTEPVDKLPAGRTRPEFAPIAPPTSEVLRRVYAMVPGTVPSLEAPGRNWSEYLLGLRTQLHNVMFRWWEAATTAPIFDGTPIIQDVALILNAAERIASDADIAIRRRGEPGLDLVELAAREKEALGKLSTITAAARQAIDYPEGK